MNKHKNKIIAGAVIAAILILAYFFGGSAPSGVDSQPSPSASPSQFAVSEPTAAADASGVSSETEAPKKESAEKSAAPAEKEETAAETSAAPSAAPEPSAKNEIQATEKTTAKQRTEPVSTENPAPIEPSGVTVSDKEMTCLLSVRCDTVLQNIARLDKDKAEIVPKDGVIFAEKNVTFYEGESVFNLLQREMKKNGIHIESMNTPVYNSVYVEGIGNLYEFDCGELSGWRYKVNGRFPNYGCSRYQLKPGDKVEWVYTCDFGIDVGGYYSAGQKDE